MIKIMRKDICPVELVHSIFDHIKINGVSCSRYIVRMFPLQKVFYPNIEELITNSNEIIKEIIDNNVYMNDFVVSFPVVVTGNVNPSDVSTINEPQNNEIPSPPLAMIEKDMNNNIKDKSQFVYNIIVTKRSHDVLTRSQVEPVIKAAISSRGRYDCRTKNPQVTLHILFFNILSI